MDFLGKRIVVTGVSSGIGERTAQLLHAAGAEVIGIDLRRPSAPVSQFVEMNLADKASIDAAAPQISGRIDGLVNNAGVSSAGGRLKAMGINVYGLRYLTEALVDRMRDGGSVVNVASVAGFGWRARANLIPSLLAYEGFPDVAEICAAHGIDDPQSYPLSKEVVVVWTMQAAHRWKDRGIRVNAVSPGPVATPILGEFRATLGEERVASDIARVGRPGTASDVAPIILFMCSDASRWINGANIAADGGLEASINLEVHGLAPAKA